VHSGCRTVIDSGWRRSRHGFARAGRLAFGIVPTGIVIDSILCRFFMGAIVCPWASGGPLGPPAFQSTGSAGFPVHWERQLSSRPTGSASFPAGPLGAPAFQPASPDAGSMPASGDLATAATSHVTFRPFNSDKFDRLPSPPQASSYADRLLRVVKVRLQARHLGPRRFPPAALKRPIFISDAAGPDSCKPWSPDRKASAWPQRVNLGCRNLPSHENKRFPVYRCLVGIGVKVGMRDWYRAGCFDR
jgi:hypothetical protein